MMICTNCGKEIDNSSFCIYCGSGQPAGGQPVNDDRSENTEQSVVASKVYCINCGKEIGESFRFCPYCEADQQGTVPVGDVDVDVDRDASSETDSAQKKKAAIEAKSPDKKPLIIITVAAVVAIPILLFGFLFIGPRLLYTSHVGTWYCAESGETIELSSGGYATITAGYNVSLGEWSESTNGIVIYPFNGGSISLSQPSIFESDKLVFTSSSGGRFVFVRRN